MADNQMTAGIVGGLLKHAYCFVILGVRLQIDRQSSLNNMATVSTIEDVESKSYLYKSTSQNPHCTKTLPWQSKMC